MHFEIGKGLLPTPFFSSLVEKTGDWIRNFICFKSHCRVWTWGHPLRIPVLRGKFIACCKKSNFNLSLSNLNSPSPSNPCGFSQSTSMLGKVGGSNLFRSSLTWPPSPSAERPHATLPLGFLKWPSLILCTCFPMPCGGTFFAALVILLPFLPCSSLWGDNSPQTRTPYCSGRTK